MTDSGSKPPTKVRRTVPGIDNPLENKRKHASSTDTEIEVDVTPMEAEGENADIFVDADDPTHVTGKRSYAFLDEDTINDIVEAC